MNSLIEDLGDKNLLEVKNFNSDFLRGDAISFEEEDFADIENLGDKSGLLQGNLLKGIEKKTIRRDSVSICFLMYLFFSVTYFFKETKWFEIAFYI